MTAGLARFCISRTAAALAAMARSSGQSEEDEAITITTRHFVGDRAEGTEDPAIIFEAGGKHFNQHCSALELPPEQGAGWREAGVVTKGKGRAYQAGPLGMSP